MDLLTLPLPGANSAFISGTRDACPYQGGAVGTPRPTKRRYKGKPFSYCGFLEKAVRPTNLRAMRYGGQANMAYRRRITLSYSEL